MGKASRAKRERREEDQELPEEFQFGPEFIEQAKSTGDVVAYAQPAIAKGGDR